MNESQSMQNDRNQGQKFTYCMIPFVTFTKKGKGLLINLQRT